MGWERSLDEWDAAGKLVQRVYQEELGRVCDFAGAVNWLAHWREGSGGADFEGWLRGQFRDSPEGRSRHGAPASLPASPLPAPPSPPSPSPEPPASVRVLRVTTPADGDFVPRMYSYWPNTYVMDAMAYVFAGHVDGRPRFFSVNLTTGDASWFGAQLNYAGTTEGWYWDREGWVYLLEGPRLRRVSPFSGDDLVVFDITDSHPGCMLWQAHSSDDGTVHSATVKRIVSDGAYPAIGTVVFRKGREEYYPAQGDLDESQVTPDGRWLVIKEDNDNRIIDLETRETRMISDADGAVGHSDCGDGILVGEDNIHGACVLWDLRWVLVPSRRRELFSTWNMGHVSIRGNRCLLSNETHLSLVALDGSGVTPLLKHGMVGSGYDYQVKANLDPSGRVATYMSNNGGDRQDVFLAVLPA